MPEQNHRKQTIIIAAIALFVVGVLFVIFGASHNGKTAPGAVGKTTVYHDPVSGQDIVKQKDKAVEGQVSSPSIPTYAGFDKFLEIGLTLTQLQSLYSAFEQYQPFASSSVQISLAVDDIQSVQPDNSDPLYRWSVLSHVVVNRKDTYKIQVYFWGENTVELILRSADGSQQIFDSGAMNTSDDPATS